MLDVVGVAADIIWTSNYSEWNAKRGFCWNTVDILQNMLWTEERNIYTLKFVQELEINIDRSP
ncbi:hypothetical protein T08_16352 [Trichinella sp. T8]|nr:hypothetical protein T08_16352 [Trichinella sp. T8]